MDINTDNGFSLEETKEMQISALKAVRDYKEMQPVEWNGHFYDFDSKSYERILAAIFALGDEGSIYWTTADNSVVEVTATDLKNVISAAAARSNYLHRTYRTLKEQIQIATDKYDVLSTVWPEE